MLIAASFPWMSIAIWFIPVALGFELGKYELVYSFVLTALGLYFAFRLEEGLEGVEFRPALRAIRKSDQTNTEAPLQTDAYSKESV